MRRAMVVLAALSWIACSDPSAEPEPIQQPDRAPAADDAANRHGSEPPKPFSLKSPAFDHNEQIPTRYTAEGEGLSPPLQWSGVPDRAVSLVLVVSDPVASDPRNPETTWVHWAVYNLPAELRSLPAGAASALPPGAEQALNDWDEVGYRGPGPLTGERRYFFELYALDTRLDLELPGEAQLLEAMQGHVLSKAETIGIYGTKPSEAR